MLKALCFLCCLWAQQPPLQGGYDVYVQCYIRRGVEACESKLNRLDCVHSYGSTALWESWPSDEAMHYIYATCSELCFCKYGNLRCKTCQYAVTLHIHPRPCMQVQGGGSSVQTSDDRKSLVLEHSCTQSQSIYFYRLRTCFKFIDWHPFSIES